jgi:homoaconitase/3-isopropylmalate dehydratase large subunit
MGAGHAPHCLRIQEQAAAKKAALSIAAKGALHESSDATVSLVSATRCGLRLARVTSGGSEGSATATLSRLGRTATATAAVEGGTTAGAIALGATTFVWVSATIVGKSGTSRSR